MASHHKLKLQGLHVFRRWKAAVAKTNLMCRKQIKEKRHPDPTCPLRKLRPGLRYLSCYCKTYLTEATKRRKSLFEKGYSPSQHGGRARGRWSRVRKQSMRDAGSPLTLSILQVQSGTQEYNGVTSFRVDSPSQINLETSSRTHPEVSRVTPSLVKSTLRTIVQHFLQL